MDEEEEVSKADSGIQSPTRGEKAKSMERIKFFAHELTSALIFNYGLDPSRSIYSLGSSSHQIGKAMNLLVNDMKELRGLIDPTRLAMLESINPLESSLSPSSSSSLRPASVIIVDRIEDLFTPTSHHPSDNTPLAHRIFNTIGKHNYFNSSGNIASDVEVDISLQPSTIYEQEKVSGQPSTDGDKRDQRDPLSSPFSALAALPLHLPPTLLSSANSLRESSAGSNVMNIVLTASEDAARVAIIDILRKAIESESGTLPPSGKKRGFGAEMLAYVQALIISPGHSQTVDKDMISTLGYNPTVCLAYESILSVAIATIEAMQRSSSKQFSVVCHWMQSYDARSTKESEVSKHLQKLIRTDLGKSSLSLEDAEIEKRIIFSEVMRALSQDCHGSQPVDILFVMLQIVRYTSLLGHRDVNESEEAALIHNISSSIRDYLLEKSPKDELQVIGSYGIVSAEVISDILSLREAAISKSNEPIEKSTSKAKFDDEWDPIGDEDEDEDEVDGFDDNLSATRQRLQLELLDAIHLYIEKIISKLGLCRHVQETKSLDSFDETNLYEAYLHSTSTSSIHSHEAQDKGLIGRIIYALVKHRELSSSLSPGPSPKSLYPLNSLRHSESSLSLLKRAGLGLLTSSLGRFGFGSSTVSAPHPGDQNVIVIFVVGGISFEEVGQIRRILDESSLRDQDMKILIGSNGTFVWHDIFNYL